MLLELRVKNFILIDQLHLHFGPGLNVLSGETGAGKSIVLDALGMLLGERSRSDYVRRREDKTVIEGVFDSSGSGELESFLTENDLDVEDYLIVTRELHATGKSGARINGRAVPVALLRQLSAYLIDLHGQDDQLSFIAPAKYSGYVDSYLPDPSLRRRIAELFDDLTAKRKELEQLSLSEQDRLQRLDFLQFQISEIESVAPQVGEEDDLQRLADRIGEAGRLLDAARLIRANLHLGIDGRPSASDLLAKSIEAGRKLAHDLFFAELTENLSSLYYSIQDSVQRLNRFASELDFESGRLDEVQNRLFELRRLEKKYGASVEDILLRLERMREEQKMWQEAVFRHEELEQQTAAAEKNYLHAAALLTAERLKAKAPLEQLVYQELLDLNLPHMRFEIQLQPKTAPSREGMDEIAFMFSSNPGEELRPLAKIASGGERSRFILALKKSLANQYQIGSMVFDEIDAGLGGVSLNSMADKLHAIARQRQILLVTHSPQIAGRAERHFFIEKTVEQESTVTRVKELNADERIQELARMIDGDRITELSLQHARAMLKREP